MAAAGVARPTASEPWLSSRSSGNDCSCGSGSGDSCTGDGGR